LPRTDTAATTNAIAQRGCASKILLLAAADPTLYENEQKLKLLQKLNDAMAESGKWGRV
jgi:hypothetical protein